MGKWRYFSRSEFQCACGCGRNKVEDTLIDYLEEARERAQIPFHIVSGYRCPAHNKAEGGKPNSAHLYGLAVDIACPNSRARFNIIDALLFAGFSRIGVATPFIHADLDGSKEGNVIWVY